jgi:hypothetical protein
MPGYTYSTRKAYGWRTCLSVEYHLGRAAFRLCKRNSKYCAWHPDLPDFFVWR